MVNLRIAHFTDTQGDMAKFSAAEEFLKNYQGIDAIVFAGDFIESHLDHPQLPPKKGRTANKMAETYDEHYVTDEIREALAAAQPKIQKFQEEQRTLLTPYIENGRVDPQKLPLEVKEKIDEMGDEVENSDEYQTLVKTKKDRKKELRDNPDDLKKKLQEIIEVDYKEIAGVFENLSNIAPVLATMGNHDLLPGYDILEPHVTFLEKTDKVTLKGKGGVEYIIQGDLNTYEVPPVFKDELLGHFIKEFFIPYESGYTPSKVSPGARPKIEAYDQAERKRLGEPGQADIWVTHKSTRADASYSKAQAERLIGEGTCERTIEYTAGTAAVFSGHWHGGQIGVNYTGEFDNGVKYGNSRIDIVLKNAEETTELDGVEVPLFYFDDDTLEINGGSDYLIITDFNAQKQVEEVLIYRYEE